MKKVLLLIAGLSVAGFVEAPRSRSPKKGRVERLKADARTSRDEGMGKVWTSPYHGPARLPQRAMSPARPMSRGRSQSRARVSSAASAASSATARSGSRSRSRSRSSSKPKTPATPPLVPAVAPLIGSPTSATDHLQ